MRFTLTDDDSQTVFSGSPREIIEQMRGQWEGGTLRQYMRTFKERVCITYGRDRALAISTRSYTHFLDTLTAARILKRLPD
jgi:hypothetical protein